MQNELILTDQDAWARLDPSCIDCEWLYIQLHTGQKLPAGDALQEVLQTRSCKCVGGSWPHVPDDWVGIE